MQLESPFRRTRRSLYVGLPAYVILQRAAQLHGLTLRELVDALLENERLVHDMAAELRIRRAAAAAEDSLRKPAAVECAQGLGDGSFLRK